MDDKPNENEKTNLTSDDVVTTGVSVRTTEEPVTVVMKAPKKHKSPLIALIIFFLLLVGGGCFAYWYFGMRNNPGYIALDAVRQLITAENLSLGGNIQLALLNTDNNRSYRLSLELGAPNNHLPTEGSAVLTLSEVNRLGEVVADHSVSTSVFTKITGKGELYFKVSASVDYIQEYIRDNLSDDDLASSFSKVATSILDILCDEWWYVSVVDLANTYEPDYAESITWFYDCAINSLNTTSLGELVDIYSSYPFAMIEKTDRLAASGNTIYRLDLNKSDLAGFINQLPETDLAEKLYTCYNEGSNKAGASAAISSKDFPELDAGDLRNLPPDDLNLYLEIQNSDHKLVSIIGEQNTSYSELDFTINFGYDALSPVAMPDEYRPVSELVEEISGLIIEIISDYFGYHYTGQPSVDCDTELECAIYYNDNSYQNS